MGKHVRVRVNEAQRGVATFLENKKSRRRKEKIKNGIQTLFSDNLLRWPSTKQQLGYFGRYYDVLLSLIMIKDIRMKYIKLRFSFKGKLFLFLTNPLQSQWLIF